MNEGELAAQSELKEILAAFPDVSHAFGYGSGVFEQNVATVSRNPGPSHGQSNNAEKELNMTETDNDVDLPMIDLILTSPNGHKWHEENLKVNPVHYAWIPRILGSPFISAVQHAGAGVYFNPMVDVEYPGRIARSKRLVKYGVIDDERLKDDLKNWDSMYIAGRMHKPIAHLQTCDEIIDLQEKYNLKYAMATALLLTSGNQTLEDILERRRSVDVSEVFEAIAGLSYMGDPRLAAGAEDPMKVKKLVHSRGQLDRFQALYMNQMKELQTMGLLTVNKSTSKLEIDLMDRSTRRKLFERLPLNLQQVGNKEQIFSSTKDLNPLNINDIKFTCALLKGGLKRIVGSPAKVQSVKGLISAGIYKSVAYAGAKLAKGSLKGLI